MKSIRKSSERVIIYVAHFYCSFSKATVDCNKRACKMTRVKKMSSILYWNTRKGLEERVM